MEDLFVYSISTANFAENKEIFSLVDKAKKGEAAAFAQLYNLYFKKIYQFIYYRVGHKETAEDLAEDVFLKAHSSLLSVNRNESFEGWLYQIARNLVIDYYRQKKATIELGEVENTLEYETNVLDLISLQEKQKILLKLLKELTTEQQQIIKLKFFEDLENSEIAVILEKSEGTIRVIQHRALAKLKELISKLEAKNHEDDN